MTGATNCPDCRESIAWQLAVCPSCGKELDTGLSDMA